MIDGISLFNKYKKATPPVRASFIYVVCSVIQKGVAFFAIPIYTRLVPSSQFGIYSLYQSWESILLVFATLNMWNYLFNNGMIKYADRKDDFVSALIGLSFLSTTILFVIMSVFCKKFVEFSGLSLVIIFLMFLDFYLKPSYEYWCSRQRFEYDVKKYAISSILITISTPFLSIALIYIYEKASVFNSGTALVSGKVFSSCCIYIFVMISLLRKQANLYDKNIWKFALGYNLPLIPHFLSVIILAQSDRIMINHLCGSSATGIYSVAYSVAAVMLIVNTAVMDSIIPWTYRCLDKQDYSKLPMVSVASLSAIGIINILISMVAPEVISLMAPHEYYSAIYLIPPVAFSNVFIFMFNLYANIEYFYEKTKLIAFASALSAMANIILNFIFIPKFGFIAAGYTTVVSYMLYALCHFVLMKHVLKEKQIESKIYNNSFLWSIALFGFILSLLVMLLYSHMILRYILVLILLLSVLGCKKKIQKKYYELSIN